MKLRLLLIIVSVVLLVPLIAGGFAFAGTDTAPASSAPALLPAPTPDTEVVAEDERGLLLEKGVPGKVYTIIDGKMVEATEGFLIGRFTKLDCCTPHPAIVLCLEAASFYSFGRVTRTINEATGEECISEIRFSASPIPP